MIRPHLNMHLKRNQDAVTQVQRRATRPVPELKGLPYNERLDALNCPTLKYRRLRTDIIHNSWSLTQAASTENNWHSTQILQHKSG